MQQNTKDLLLITLLGAVLFLPFLGGVHLFDWDEINFAEAAREMLLTDNYLRVQIDYQPFWEKPPLFLWLQAISMRLFGIGEYAARFPNAICGIVTLILLFIIGKKHFNRQFAWFWVWAYCGSILPHLYFKSGIIDPWFNLLIFLSIYCFHGYRSQCAPQNTNTKGILLSGAFAGLAILTKGPAALLIIGLVLFVNWIWERFRLFISIPQFLLWLLVAFSVTGIWFGVETAQNGTWFTETFIKYQWRLFSTPDAGHGGFFGYHFVVLLLGVFPASFIALPAFLKVKLTGNQALLRRYMLILFWVVLILFSLVQSKIVHYSSLCYYPLTFLAALTAYNWYNGVQKPKRALYWTIGAFGIFLGFIVCLVPYLGKNIDLLRPLFAKDAFALANLDAAITWSGFEVLAGLVLIGISIYALISFKNEQIKRAILSLFIGTALFVQCTLFLFINNIEGYSQRAAIEFYKSLQGKEIYIKTVGFKSYAHLFYTNKQAGGDIRQQDIEWLLRGNDLDRDAYFVTKINKIERLDKEKKLQRIGEENGFVFYKREKVK